MSTTCDIVGCTGMKMPEVIVCRDHALLIRSAVQHANEVVPKVRPLTVSGKPIDGWIYYLRLDEKIKVGWTANLEQRIKSYPPHAFILTEHPGTRNDERDLHRSFKPSRAAGREWYHPTQELLAHIQRAEATEMQRRSDEHLARVSAAADEEDAMNAAWPGSAVLRMHRDDPLSVG